MRSIRTYLLSRILGGAALALAGAGVVVYAVVTRSLEAQFDRNLTDRVKGFASLLFQVEDQVEFEFSDELMPEYEASRRPAYFQLRFEDGRFLERSNSLRGADLLVAEDVGEGPVWWNAHLPDGRPGRYVAQLVEVHHLYPEEGPNRPEPARLQVVVARGREGLVGAQRSLLLGCTGVALVLMILLAVSCRTAVGRGLEPADRLARALDRIQVDNLPAGLDAGELPVELRSMAEKSDALIRRVAVALERERRTTADIAHELRTPISEMLTVSEVALREQDDAEGGRRALETIRDAAGRMGRSVATLLKLARLETGTETFDRDRVDLGVLVADVLRSLAGVGRERDLRIENGVTPGEGVEGDREVLRIVVSNLIGNAFHHSPRSSAVRCRVEGTGEAWRLVVENEAGELREEDLRVLSEPFWRKDHARADRDRSGLGLALSRVLARKTGFELSFELEGGSFRAVLGRETSAGRDNGRAGPRHASRSA